MAAQEGHDATVRALLDAGADKDLADADGVTPMLVAFEARDERRHARVCLALLDATSA